LFFCASQATREPGMSVAPLTERQLFVLADLHRYCYRVTADIRDEIAIAEKRERWDKDCAVTRELMRSLLAPGYVRRHQPHVPGDSRFKGPPVYVLTMGGSCELARAKRDTRFILTVEATFRDHFSLYHYCAVARMHACIDRAIKAQKYVT